MVFSSQIFLFAFLPLALAIYYAFARWSSRAQNAVLAALGYIFYGWAEPRFVVLMFVTTFVDWMFSLVVASDSWTVGAGHGCSSQTALMRAHSASVNSGGAFILYVCNVPFTFVTCQCESF